MSSTKHPAAPCGTPQTSRCRQRRSLEGCRCSPTQATFPGGMPHAPKKRRNGVSLRSPTSIHRPRYSAMIKVAPKWWAKGKQPHFPSLKTTRNSKTSQMMTSDSCRLQCRSLQPGVWLVLNLDDTVPGRAGHVGHFTGLRLQFPPTPNSMKLRQDVPGTHPQCHVRRQKNVEADAQASPSSENHALQNMEDNTSTEFLMQFLRRTGKSCCLAAGSPDLRRTVSGA